MARIASRAGILRLAALGAGALVACPAHAVPPQESVKSAVCKHHLPLSAGQPYGLLSLPAPRRGNDSGVMLLVNCSRRQVVRLRDPSHSPRHLAELVYDPEVRAKLPHDPDQYEVLNFNQAPNNSGMEHTQYAENVGWRGPCLFKGLELTTVDARNGDDRRTLTFDLDICANQVLAMLEPPGSGVRRLSVPAAVTGAP